MNAKHQDFGHGITAIDSLFVRPRLAAIHLIEEKGQAAIIDTGTNYSLPYVLDVLNSKGLSTQDVAYVIVTHVHLDHAGAAGLMLQHFPYARLVVHPRGARHMIDPAKLVAGACAVYGEAAVRQTYGEIIPVAAESVIEAPDNFELDFNGRKLFFLDTPGHARHHFCIWDERSRSIFSGDTFGISYRELDVEGREFIFPTCTPVQFEPDAAHASIDRIMSLEPSQIYLTHYSRITQLARLAADLHRMLDQYEALGNPLRDIKENRHERLKAGVEEIMLDALRAHGCGLPLEEISRLMGMDFELNAQGIGVWLDKSL
ncbi:MAG: MBL fold metallo-hydrolase [Sulfurimicrobium sp.]|jgi:glyoxylase-like metal-dependent hydrolase (beta-lactamase superfamily II)|nr:MBL fold metallo-hydrolase [Sulfurimicrobium sp.]MDO9191193.1 MBL fold metallo-hydrolase [Sulfurimicrobium sp.]MDP1705755.1 MBL fold metallo-hydrolase [Sulfurimicrobium sp.]MDP1897923.1 MBL fold metallo-hydrolase [Sulfurimicrobium sp.]MDP2199754.1 MBL fold metallo-hydrolase [Sulfurimicrobium sp.]